MTVQDRNTDERKLYYAKKLVEREFSYFAKFDEVSGISACPGRKSLPTLANSCYNKNYKQIFRSRLMNVRPGDDPLKIG